MDQPTEIISGQKLIEMLYEWIDSRRICKMEIPDTSYGWFTLLSGIQEESGAQYLLVDTVAGFEKALSHSQRQEVSLQILEKDGIHFQFKTRVIKSRHSDIQTELPSEIWRIQRRAGFRITALSGTEITFHIHPEKEKRAKVKDYGLGGVAFSLELEKDVKLNMNDKVTNIHLRLPQGREFRTIHIASAVVRRVELDSQGKYLCALEFLEFPENSKQQLWNYMIDTQRSLIRKLKSI
jgi:c-di-GMP-binding flagellar brake protein YcgR